MIPSVPGLDVAAAAMANTSSSEAGNNRGWMAEPLTDGAVLEANADTMKCKMEMMLMRIQKEFCQALENEEDPR